MLGICCCGVDYYVPKRILIFYQSFLLSVGWGWSYLAPNWLDLFLDVPDRGNLFYRVVFIAQRLSLETQILQNIFLTSNILYLSWWNFIHHLPTGVEFSPSKTTVCTLSVIFSKFWKFVCYPSPMFFQCHLKIAVAGSYRNVPF